VRTRDLLQPFVRATRPLVQAGEKLVVAVSGGADSTALLDLAHRAAPSLGIELVVAHLDHGWRPASAMDAELVARAAEGRGLALVVEKLPSPVPTEAAGRSARLALYARAAAAHGAAGVFLGHTADDQSETVITHLLRGSGLEGLAAMDSEDVVCGVRLLRPLLAFRRTELRGYCRRRGLAFVDDPTNQDPRFLRNRVRHELLPLLEEISPGATGALARLAELASDERDLVAVLVAGAWPTTVAVDADLLRVDRSAFRRLPTTLQRSVLRRIGAELLGPAPDLSLERVEAARLALLKGRGGAVVEWPAGARLRLAGQGGIFAKEPT
jgi:tRNA(Ile)-lysidine synthase